MKKNRFFLLLTLILSFVLALSLGITTAFADPEGDGEGDEGDPTPATIVYTDLFTGGTVSKDGGIKIDLGEGGQSDYKYDFEIGADKVFIFSVGADADENGLNDMIEGVDSEQKVRLFFLNVISGTDNDYLYFSTDGTDLFVSLNDFDVNNDDLFVKIDNPNEIKFQVLGGKIVIDNAEIGDASLEKSYATFQVKAYLPTTLTVKTINGIDFADDVTLESSKPIVVAESGFFDRQKAISGVTYTLNYKAYDMLSDTVKVISYQRLEDANGEEVQEDIISNEGDANPLLITKDRIKFNNSGLYRVVIVATNEGGVMSDELVFEYDVKEESTENSVYYEFTQEDLDKIQEEINKKIYTENAGSERIYMSLGDTFSAPSVSEILKSEYFEYDSISTTLYYACRTTSSDFISSTSSSFTVNEPGLYVYFILGTDEFGNGFVYNDDFKDTYKLKEDGWYIYDEDLAEDVKVIPIFSFEIINNAAPEITVEKQNVGILGETYKITTISVNASNKTSEDYTLYFMSEKNAKAYLTEKGFEFNKDSFETDALYLEELNRLIAEGKIVEITADTAEEWDSTNLTFIPKAKGNYYVKCKVLSSNANSDTVLTYAIKVSKSMHYAKYEKEFFKYNKTAFIYLGISVVSFIGILLVLFIKPKKKVSESDEI